MASLMFPPKRGAHPTAHIALAKACHMTTKFLGTGKYIPPTKSLEGRRPDIGKL